MKSTKISVWEDGQLKDASIDELKTYFNRPTWINISDPSLEDLGLMASAIGIPRQSLIVNLRSNYPHADTFAEYTKIFSWYLSPPKRGGEFAFFKSPVVVFTNRVSAIVISHSRTGTLNMLVEEFSTKDLTAISIPARVIYTILMYLLQTYERNAEEFERYTDKLEGKIPPWPRKFYAESFVVRKEASRLLRMLRHFRIMTESLAKEKFRIPFTEEELRIFDTLYDRALGTEEATDTTLETIRDMISLHLDTMSHDMNKAMRLMAAITAIVAIPSVIGSLLGTNLLDVPFPWDLWKIIFVSVSVAVILTVYFFWKGWIISK